MNINTIYFQISYALFIAIKYLITYDTFLLVIEIKCFVNCIKSY